MTPALVGKSPAWSAPEAVATVLEELRADPRGTCLLAGGTDAWIQIRQNGPGSLKRLLSLHRVRELNGITCTDDEILIGATTRIAELVSSKVIQEHLPLLGAAAAQIGSVQIRNLATIGGNIVNAAACADTVPPLLVHDAELILVSHLGRRVVPLTGFIERPYRTQIARDELLTAVRVPLPSTGRTLTAFRKLGRRRALNITRISVAVRLTIDTDGTCRAAGITGGSVMPSPHRISIAEEMLAGKRLRPSLLDKTAAAAAEYVFNLQPPRWSAQYKQPVFENMLRDTLSELAALAKGGAGE